MRSASGSKASRVCMRLLVDRTKPLARRGNCIFYSRGSRAAGYIVDCENIVQAHKPEEVLCEVRIELLQVCKFQGLQFALLIERDAHGLAHDLVRNAERHALAD